MSKKYLVKIINKKTIKIDGEEVKSFQSKLSTLRELMFRMVKDVKIIKNDVSVLKDDISILKKDVNAMNNTPTMKKELKIFKLS